MILLAPAASAAPSDQHGGNPTAACNGTHHSDSGHGANRRGAYDQTCDGSPSGNGNGGGQAIGKPCAGCVGNADDKNPPGQAPDGSDHNAGYECDRNHGVGRTNPAHTGCRSGVSTSTDVDGDGTSTAPKQRTAPRSATPPAAVDAGVFANGTATDSPAPVATPASASVEAAVLGTSFVPVPVGDELARVAAASPFGAAELPRTGGEGPDLLMAGIALTTLGTALRRAARLRR